MDKRSAKSKKKNSLGTGSNVKTCQMNGVPGLDLKLSSGNAPSKCLNQQETLGPEVVAKPETNGNILTEGDSLVQVSKKLPQDTKSGSLPYDTSRLGKSDVFNCGAQKDQSDLVHVITNRVDNLELVNGDSGNSKQERSESGGGANSIGVETNIKSQSEAGGSISNVEQSNSSGFSESASLISHLNPVAGSNEKVKQQLPTSGSAENTATFQQCDKTKVLKKQGLDLSESDGPMFNGLSETKDISNSSNVEAQVDGEGNDNSIHYISYESELQMASIMKLIQKDLSEPYSVYTYRYFIHNWPKLCFLAMDGDQMVGVIVCKLDVHKQINKRGYIAMLAVDARYRRRKIGSNLVLKSIRAMVEEDADEIVLETEITNKSALRLYENLGFVRDKRLFRYYLNGVDALRLKLWLK